MRKGPPSRAKKVEKAVKKPKQTICRRIAEIDPGHHEHKKDL